MLCISYEGMDRTGAANSGTHFYSDADNNVILSRADCIDYEKRLQRRGSCQLSLFLLWRNLFFEIRRDSSFCKGARTLIRDSNFAKEHIR